MAASSMLTICPSSKFWNSSPLSFKWSIEHHRAEASPGWTEEQREPCRNLAASLQQVREEERHRLPGTLHDDISQILTPSG